MREPRRKGQEGRCNEGRVDERKGQDGYCAGGDFCVKERRLMRRKGS